MAKTASKTRKKTGSKEEGALPIVQARIPVYGERVRRTGSDMEYEITYVSPDNTYVNIGIPRTNFECLRVPVAALIFLEESRTPPKPAKPAYNLVASRSTSLLRSTPATRRPSARSPYSRNTSEASAFPMKC